MGIVIIIGLALLLVHAASTEAQLQAQLQQANAEQGLPTPSPVSSGGATPTPSPATALGGPGAFRRYQLLLDTNSRFPGNGAGLYTITDIPPGTNGIPLAMVPAVVFNGFNPTPVTDKTLQTQTTGTPAPYVSVLPAPTPLYKL